MIPAAYRKRLSAFTLIELLVVVAIIAILAGTIHVPSKGAKERAKMIHCMSNLKQVSLGYVMWAGTKGDRFPWAVSTNVAGTMELVANGNAADHFRPLSTFLKNPETLHCPADMRSRQRTNSYVGFSNTNLSYFVSLDARILQQTNLSFLIIAGDRHLSADNQSVSPGLFGTTNYASLGWKGGHPTRGALAFVDGHVEAVKSDRLAAVFQRQAIATNRLVIP